MSEPKVIVAEFLDNEGRTFRRKVLADSIVADDNGVRFDQDGDTVAYFSERMIGWWVDGFVVEDGSG